MVDLNPYGRKGCRCFKSEAVADGVYYGRWMPNAGCPFHGVLAGMVKPRDETGTYRVVHAPDSVYDEIEKAEAARAELNELNDRLWAGIEQARRGETKDRGSFAGDTDGEYCPAGVHSMFDFCPGRAVCEEGFHPDDDESVTYVPPDLFEELKADHPPPPPPRVNPDLVTYICKITEKERGVLATVRRWARHVADAWSGRPGWH